MGKSNVVTRAQSESMCHVGVARSAMKEILLQKLVIGQQYRVRSTHATSRDEGKVVMCRLTDRSRNVAVFLHKNGTPESFTYQDLWIQLMDGTMA